MAGQSKPVSEYRKSVDIKFDDAAASFALIPHVAFQKQGYYPNRKFKNAPTWAKAIKLIPVAKVLLEASGGYNIHQKCLLRHMKCWAKQSDFEVDGDLMDDAIYAVRAFISQLLNHKYKDRVIPKMFEPKFGCIWSMLATGPPQPRPPGPLADGRSDLIGSDLEMIEDDSNSEPEVVDVFSSDDDFDLAKFKLHVFSSADPEISMLLGEGDDKPANQPSTSASTSPANQQSTSASASTPTSRRLNRKQADPSVRCNTGVSVNELQRLAVVTPVAGIQTSTPKAFATLNKKIKDKQKEKKIKKGTDEEHLAWKKFAKREHWKAWKVGLDKASAAGKTESEIKKAAATAGRKRTAVLRDQLARGEINLKGEVVDASISSVAWASVFSGSVFQGACKGWAHSHS